MNSPRHRGPDELWSLLDSLAQKGDGEVIHATPTDCNLLRELAAHQLELEIQNRELREAQSALESSRNGYLELYDFAPVALCTFDANGVIGELNLAAARLLRRPRESILGEPFLTMVQFGEPFRFWAHLNAAKLSKRASHELEFEVQGTRVCVEAVSVPVVDAVGKVSGFRTAFTDITARKDLEAHAERMHELERRMRARFEALDEASLSISRALTTRARFELLEVLESVARQVCHAPGCVGVSLSIDERSGLPPGRVGTEPPASDETDETLAIPVRFAGRQLGVLSVTHTRGLTPVDHDELRTLEMLAERAGIAIEVARITAGQERAALRLSTLEQASHCLTGIASLDEALAALRHIASLVLPELARACLVYVAEPTGELRLLAACHAHKPLESCIEALHHPKHGAQQRSALLAVAVEERRIVSGTCLRDVIAPDPALDVPEFDVGHVLAIPLIARNHVVGVLCLGRPTAEPAFEADYLRWAEELGVRCAYALDSASLLDELRAAVESRDNLLATVSHDLRSPLNAISLSASALAGAPTNVERRRAYKQVELIKRSASRMTHLVTDLLLASNIETGRLRVELRTESATGLMAEARELAEGVAAAKHLTIECAPESGLPTVRADRDRVLQVFSNLIGNAVKFTPPGGFIRLEAQRKAGVVEFSVSDTGPGIPRAHLARVFERYWTADAAGHTHSRRASAGLGLGLCIAKGIVEAHGGTMHVASEPGHGAVFSFTLSSAPD